MSKNPAVSTSDWLAALRDSQQRLAALVTAMSDADVAAPSQASEWSIAQVLSHLGSGAVIFTMFLDAALDGSPVPGAEAFGPVWDEWNAKSPPAQARDAITTDTAFVEKLDALDDAEREAWRLEMFGGEQRLADLIRLRLGEHALHSWDIAASLDPGATVLPDAVTLLIDHLDQLVARAGKSPAQPVTVAVTTESPDRSFTLAATSDGVSLSPRDSGTEPADSATLRLPAEALIRLVYGRLDPDHTPPLTADGIDLDDLRQIFPGV